MPELGDWSDHDKQMYVGKIDRIHVSIVHFHRVEYFIDHFLHTRGFTISNHNRDIVAAELEKFTGCGPFQRDDLIYFLDRRIK